MFALPEHRAHGRSNAFQKHRACCVPAGSPRFSGSPGRKAQLPNCRCSHRGNSTQAAACRREWGEGSKKAAGSKDRDFRASGRCHIYIQLCVLGAKYTILFLKIESSEFLNAALLQRDIGLKTLRSCEAKLSWVSDWVPGIFLC